MALLACASVPAMAGRALAYTYVLCMCPHLGTEIASHTGLCAGALQLLQKGCFFGGSLEHGARR